MLQFIVDKVSVTLILSFNAKRIMILLHTYFDKIVIRCIVLTVYHPAASSSPIP